MMDSKRLKYAGPMFQHPGEFKHKVLIVVEASGGGSGRHVVELIDGLVQRGCEVHILYSEARADHNFRSKLAALSGVHTRKIAMRREPHWSDLGCLLEIRRYMQAQGRFHVVHAHSSKAGALARVAAIGTGAACVYTPHAMRTMDPTLHPLARMFYRVVEVILARLLSEALIAVSEAERQHVMQQGVAGDKVHTVANAIPAVPHFDRAAIRASLGLAPEDVCIGFIGRLVPQKAPQRFIDAVAAVARSNPRVRAVVVGTGPLDAATRETARECGVLERVIWAGHRPGPDVLPGFDVLMMPSLYEGMPYVLLEALAVGVPVLSTDVGGVHEAVDDGVTGFVVPQEDGQALVDRLSALVSDAALRHAMAEASLRKSREMSVERMVELTLQVYQAAMLRRVKQHRQLSVGLDPKRAG